MYDVKNVSILNLIPNYKFEERWEKLYLASEIVDATFNYFQIEYILKDKGRKPWDLKNMIKLIFLGSVEKNENSVKLNNDAKTDIFYRVLCDEIMPSARSIRDYRKIYKSIFQLILSFTLIATRKMDLSSFYHVSGDGTIKMACNSPFNTIKRKDIHLLIKHYLVEKLTKKEIKKLRKPAKKFIYKNKLDPDEKINILFDWLDKLDLTGQNSLPMFDVDARWMLPKDKGQKYKKLAYNVQVCTDTESKLICGINVVQFPTDHYQIPALLDQTIQNLQMKPSIVSADTIYATISNFFYLKQHGISARIPTREQNKKLIDNPSENPYAKEYFEFDEIRNIYICPQKQELTPDGVYDAPLEKGGFNKKKIVYSNHTACKNCPVKSKCTKANHRTITRYLHELSYEVEKIMDTKEGQEEYKKRSSTVESHNGTFRRIYHYDELPLKGLETIQGLMFMIASAYNVIRIYNITKEKGLDLYKIIEYIRLIGLRIIN